MGYMGEKVIILTCLRGLSCSIGGCEKEHQKFSLFCSSCIDTSGIDIAQTKHTIHINKHRKCMVSQVCADHRGLSKLLLPTARRRSLLWVEAPLPPVRTLGLSRQEAGHTAVHTAVQKHSTSRMRVAHKDSLEVERQVLWLSPAAHTDHTHLRL